LIGVARAFLIETIAKAAIARAVAALPFLGWPVIGPLFSWGVTLAMQKWIYEPVRDTIVLADIARVNFEKVSEFDKAYLKVRLIDKSEVSREQKRKTLDEAHDNLVELARYRVRSVAA